MKRLLDRILYWFEARARRRAWLALWEARVARERRDWQ